MIRLLIADDHAIVREGLKQLFSLTTDLTVVAEATNGSEVLERLRGGGIDVVMLDMSMPGISGIDLIRRIHGHEGAPPILVLTMHNEPQIARRAIKSGVVGYVTKDSEPEVLLAAIRRVAAGGRSIDPSLAEAMVFETSAPAERMPHELLSDRELQILQLLAKGLSVNEVADTLSISNKTVSTHKARLMEKMSFQSNAELVRYAVTAGLVE